MSEGQDKGSRWMMARLAIIMEGRKEEYGGCLDTLFHCSIVNKLAPRLLRQDQIETLSLENFPPAPISRQQGMASNTHRQHAPKSRAQATPQT